MHSYIAVEGPIGAGKTTLVRSFQKTLEAQMVLDVSNNPFLEDFYKGVPNAAFKTQMYFLISRFQQQVALKSSIRSDRLLVCDYLFAKDKIFAYLNLDDHEVEIYDKYFTALSPYVSDPDLVVYLEAPVDILIERVRRRNLDFEAQVSEGYVEELIKAYNYFFYHYKDGPLLIVNTAEIDFVESRGDLMALIHRITGDSIRGVHYYHPIRKKKG